MPSSGWSSPLPKDLLQQTARNVQIASLVVASVWLVGLFINDVIIRWVFRSSEMLLATWPTPGRSIALAAIAVALLVFLFSRRVSDPWIIDLGLALEIATALLIGLLEAADPEPRRTLSVSWIAVMVVVYPSIVPAPLRKTCFAALIAASMGPLGIALARLGGVEYHWTGVQWLWRFVPNYLAAGLAVIPAALIRRLGRQVQSARELGSYQLAGLIGSGGMGEVYRATHRMLARPAAIKVMRPEVLNRPAERARVAVERFRREAEAAANLRSPHTIELYDFGVSDDGAFYYVMELLDGVDLERLVEQFGPVPPERAIHLLRQACDSLGEAHVKGLMHRDIKPSNMQACRMGLSVDFVKVLDFGLVKPQPGRDANVEKLTGPEVGTPGTPAFMAPEAVSGSPAPDHRADIYALGCVAYWLLTGELVFDAVSSARMLMLHVEGTPRPPSQRAPNPIPAELDAVVLACLAKQREDRPANVEELSRLLAACPVQTPWTEARAQAWWAKYLPVARPLQHTASSDQGEQLPLKWSTTVRPVDFV